MQVRYISASSFIFFGSRCGSEDSGPLSLVDLCVEDLCRNLLNYEEIPSGLPVELVDKILASLARVKPSPAKFVISLVGYYSPPPFIDFSFFVSVFSDDSIKLYARQRSRHSNIARLPTCR